jgi:hypothetical protein
MEKEVLHNKISGLFISSQGLGETLGPVLGSVFDSLVGFRSSQDIVAFILFGFMMLYFVMCGRRQLLVKNQTVIEPLLNPINDGCHPTKSDNKMPDYTVQIKGDTNN